MSERHREYLRRRRFNPGELEQKYNLLGTGPVGHLPHRIVIPIFYQGRMVSWQARDITGQAESQYVSASPAAEEVRHKNILYNLDNCRGQTAIIVEGVTDVWRLGDGCCATFGVKFTAAQARLMTGFARIFLLYDGDPQAQKQAQKLCRTLSGMSIQAENVLLDKDDPGSMEQSEADSLKQELLGR